VDRVCQRGLLLIEQEADPGTQVRDRDRRDVVACDCAAVLQTVCCRPSRHFGGQAADRRCDRRDRDGIEMRPYERSGQAEHGTRLIESRQVDRTHQPPIGSPAACSASADSSGSGPVTARISASQVAIARRRSRSRARVTTAARLRCLPVLTIGSTNSTRSSGSRTAICLLIPGRYRCGIGCGAGDRTSRSWTVEAVRARSSPIVGERRGGADRAPAASRASPGQASPLLVRGGPLGQTARRRRIHAGPRRVWTWRAVGQPVVPDGPGGTRTHDRRIMGA